MKYKGINHLAMATGDMEGTIRFWRDLLGMRLVATMGEPGYRHYFFEVSDRDLIAFFEWPDVTPIEEKEHGRPVKGPIAFDHVSFDLESDEQLWELKERLDAAGVWVSEMIEHGLFHSIYSYDPNGIPIEFSCGAGGPDIRTSPEMHDTHPVAAACEGADPQPGKWPSRPPAAHAGRIYPGYGAELFKKRAGDCKT